MEFKRTSAINKILTLNKRKRVIQGGSSAGKTIAILAILIDKCTKTPNLEVSVVAESIPHLKRGALKDFIKIMKATNRFNEMRYNITERRYTFQNNSYIEFFSPESVIGSRRHILYINEAPFIKYEDYYQLAIRTSDLIFIDFNPINEFWAHNEVLKEKDSDFIILSYKDNEALPINVIEDFNNAVIKASEERSRGVDGYWCNFERVYINGQIGSLQGVVFNNWKTIDTIPKDAELIAYGLDWGFAKDQTGVVACYKWNNKILVKELLYEVGLTNSMIAQKLIQLQINRHIDIIADSAEPKSIQDLINFGFNVLSANKGEDSIRQSINKLQEFEILVTEDSLNLIKELRGYVWQKKQDGSLDSKPIDRNNHLIDPIRYVALNKLGQSYFEIL